MVVERSQYLGTLGGSEPATLDDKKLDKALQRAYEQRSFEIEHYWKRGTFFWAFQVAIFAAFGLVWKEPAWSKQSGALVLLLSALGFLTAIANYLSALGSKFWQENWEKHIDMLEDAVEGRLYKTVWLSDGKRSYSVSGVNSTLGRFFIAFWGLIAAYSAFRYLDFHPGQYIVRFFPCVDPRRVYVSILALLILFGAAWLCAQKSALPGTSPTSDGKRGKRHKAWDSWWRSSIAPDGKTCLHRRDAPDEMD